MGWAFCGVVDGREVGYGIAATCDARRCNTVIDRGLGYLCGSMHHARWSDEPGCGGYFCDVHLGYIGPRGGCPHRRHRHDRSGKTHCQLLYSEVGFPGEERRRVYCACHGWEAAADAIRLDDLFDPLIAGYQEHVVMRMDEDHFAMLVAHHAAMQLGTSATTESASA